MRFLIKINIVLFLFSTFVSRWFPDVFTWEHMLIVFVFGSIWTALDYKGWKDEL